ncbi:MAG: hypothetical protein Q8R00_04525 [Candidatus Nanoarchaeia archaeon]|nr:hypothetical protein [Candidatus Nanoarchaeia archaeon]
MVFNTFLDTSREIGVFSIVIPFFLAFTLVYAILEKVRLFEKKKYSIALAAIIGFFTTASMQISSLMNSFLEKVGFGLIIMVSFMMILGLLGIKDQKKLSWIGFATFFVILYFQFVNETIEQFIVNLVLNRYILVFLGAILTIWWIVGFPSSALPIPGRPTPAVTRTSSRPPTTEELEAEIGKVEAEPGVYPGLKKLGEYTEKELYKKADSHEDHKH